MGLKVEKEHLEEREIEELEGGGDGKSSFKPDYQYSKEELLKFSNHPLCRRRPALIDPNIGNLNCWVKTAGWNNNKRSDTPTERGDDSHKVTLFL